MKPTKFEPFGAFIFHNTGSSWISSFPSALNLLILIILILNTGTWSNPIYVTPEFDIFDHLMAPRANTQPSTSHVSNLNSPYCSQMPPMSDIWGVPIKISFSTNVILTISCKVLRVLAQKDCHRAAFTPKVRLLHTRQRTHYQITIITINIIIRVYLSELLHNEIRTVDFWANIALYTQSLRGAISKIRFLARSRFSCPVSKCKT